MTFTFRSNELGREIAIAEVHEMSLDETRRFHAELTVAVYGMNDSIAEALRLESDAGVKFDRDWMHKARMKRRITIAFASETKRRLIRLEGLEGLEERRSRRSAYERQRDKFQSMQTAALRDLLKEELGPGVLEEIEIEAHDAAEKSFKEWLAAAGQEQVFIA